MASDRLAAWVNQNRLVLEGATVNKALIPLEAREATNGVEGEDVRWDALVELTQRSQPPLGERARSSAEVRDRPPPSAAPAPPQRRARRRQEEEEEEEQAPVRTEPPLREGPAAKRRRKTDGINLQRRRAKHIAVVVSNPQTKKAPLHDLIRQVWNGNNNQTPLTRENETRATMNCVENGDPYAYFVVRTDGDPVVAINPALVRLVSVHLRRD